MRRRARVCVCVRGVSLSACPQRPHLHNPPAALQHTCHTVKSLLRPCCVDSYHFTTAGQNGGGAVLLAVALASLRVCSLCCRFWICAAAVRDGPLNPTHTCLMINAKLLSSGFLFPFYQILFYYCPVSNF